MSTSEPIRIAWMWDRDNFEKSFESAYTYHYKNSARRYIGWLFIAMAQFGVVAALKKGSVALLMFSTLLILYWYVVKKWLLKRRALQSFENSPFKDKKIEMIVTEEGITRGKEFVPWEEIDGIVPADEALMIYQQGQEFYIPSSAFESIEAMSRFKSIAKKKGKLYA